MNTYEVPVTIADKRRVTVQANTAREAEVKVRKGKYKTLGPSLERSFLIVGEPELKQP